MSYQRARFTLFMLSINLLVNSIAVSSAQTPIPHLTWNRLPALPSPLGVAGPVTGVHDDVLIAGGGANFAKPVWDSTKQWHSQMFAMDLRATDRQWQDVAPLPYRLGYAACVSTKFGVLVIGGNDDRDTFKQCWLIQAERGSVSKSGPSLQLVYRRMPDLPTPLVYGQACLLGQRVFVLTGQHGSALGDATNAMFEMQLPTSNEQGLDPDMLRWQRAKDFPGGPRAFAQVACLRRSTDTSNDAMVVVGGRRQIGEQVQFLSDTWLYEPKSDRWQAQADAPVAVAAGTAGPIAIGQVAVISGDDGRLFTETDRLRDAHPGFPKRVLIFDQAQNRWQAANDSPANQVTSCAVSIGFDLLLVSGEVRPRVRTPDAWLIQSRPLSNR